MENQVIQTIVVSLVLGVASYILARQLKIAPLLFYMLAGMAAGPAGIRAINLEQVGRGLPILIEIAIAIILFEGGLALPPEGFKAVPKAIKKLLLIVIPLTGASGILLAHFVIGLSWKVSLVFGALIVVTGPTVVGPLLKSIGLNRKIEILLRYEAIWGDCIGVLLSALALEIVLVKDFSSAGGIFMSFASRIMTGTIIGAGAGVILARIILPWVARLGDPELPGMTALAGALGTFWMSNKMTGSSGPLACVVAGFTLSYLRADLLQEMRRFKDQISMVFISSLFVMLSASINPAEQADRLPAMAIVAAVIGLVVRPAAVLYALAGTEMDLRERLFIGFIGPRGIIAIATASYASLALVQYGGDMLPLLTLTFAIIFLSGAFSTLFGYPLARILKVSISDHNSGIIFVGVNELSLAMTRLIGHLVPVRFIDTNEQNCEAVKGEGFEALCKNGLDEKIYEDAVQEGFRRAIIMTPNDHLNVLILQHALAHFGNNGALRVPAKPGGVDEGKKLLSKRFVAFASDISLRQAVDGIRTGEMELIVMTPQEAAGRQAISLIELVNGGARIVRADQNPKEKAIYLSMQGGGRTPKGRGIIN